MVLELRGDPFIEQSMSSRLQELRDAGYMLALDQFRAAAELEPLFKMVDIVKLDMLALGARELASHAFELRPYELKLVASKIETPDDFKLAHGCGRDLFQGYFFCRPHLLGGRAIAPSRLGADATGGALQDPDIELSSSSD